MWLGCLKIYSLPLLHPVMPILNMAESSQAFQHLNPRPSVSLQLSTNPLIFSRFFRPVKLVKFRIYQLKNSVSCFLNRNRNRDKTRKPFFGSPKQKLDPESEISGTNENRRRGSNRKKPRVFFPEIKNGSDLFLAVIPLIGRREQFHIEQRARKGCSISSEVLF